MPTLVRAPAVLPRARPRRGRDLDVTAQVQDERGRLQERRLRPGRQQPVPPQRTTPAWASPSRGSSSRPQNGDDSTMDVGLLLHALGVSGSTNSLASPINRAAAYYPSSNHRDPNLALYLLALNFKAKFQFGTWLLIADPKLSAAVHINAIQNARTDNHFAPKCAFHLPYPNRDISVIFAKLLLPDDMCLRQM